MHMIAGQIATALKERYAPQGLIIGTPISQYASYSAMFCPLHSYISKEQHEKHLQLLRKIQRIYS